MNSKSIQERFCLQRQGQEVHFFIPKSVYFGFCSKPLNELVRCSLKDLKNGEPAKGFYLLLHTLDDPITCSGTMLLVQDHTEETSICFLYEHVCLDSEFNSRTVLVLKEPCLIATTGQDFAVVVGSPSDLSRVDLNHGLYDDTRRLGWSLQSWNDCNGSKLRTPEDWRDVGNGYFKTGKYDASIEAYLAGADMCRDPITKSVLNLNLSAAYLLSGRYESAIKHAQLALETDPENEKGLYRIARAYYELTDYKRSKLHFESLIRSHSSNRNARLELQRCNERLKESVGQVDTCKLHRASFNLHESSVDFGRFVGSIRVTSVQDKGRGVVASCDIAQGVLILAEKALLANWTESHGAGTQGLTSQLVRAFLNNPKFISSTVFNLSSNNPDRDSDQELILDFAVKSGQPVVDYERFLSIINTNSFSLDGGVEALSSKRALFYYASYFNHSCVPNASYEIYGDVIAIRTLTEVSAGDEISICYVSNTESFCLRRNVLRTHGFTCTCELCRTEGLDSDEAHEYRDALLNEFKRELKSGIHKDGVINYQKLVEIIEKMKRTFKHGNEFQVHLFKMCLLYAQALETLGFNGREKFLKAIDSGLRCVGLSSDCLTSWATDKSFSLPKKALICKLLFQYASVCARAELSYDRLEKVQEWVCVLRCLEKLFTGGDVEELEDRFKNSALTLMLLRNVQS